ncbi:glycosyltransferase family protein [Formosa algae]|uniref:hypothetical protein n=1 Tax=Formosa algae TaxID=225843 RepID=UPI000CCE1648|nr:hypothetical protein [Formosa algae]PNW26867.1 hypothetical protein BKP44_15415 [Formosa algae]
MKVLITHYSPINPYCILLGNAYIQNGHEVLYGVYNFYDSNIVPDILHIQWPESLYKWQVNLKLPEEENRLVNRLEWYKSQGTKIVHTIHNIEPHELENDYESKLYELIIDYSDVLIHHGANSIDLINNKYPKARHKKSIVAHHGHYLNDYKYISKIEARQALNIPIDKLIILNFGLQRGYKNQNFLRSVFDELKIDNKILLNAGFKHLAKVSLVRQFLSNIKTKLIKPKENNIINHYKHIPQVEVPIYFNAADVVFLGHGKGLNSGVLAMSATYSKPVVFPDIGNFKEQVDGWIGESFEVNNVNSALKALNKITKQVQSNSDFDNTDWLKNNSWDNHVKTILSNL